MLKTLKKQFSKQRKSELRMTPGEASKDAVRGNTVCNGLCLVSGACETVALCCFHN